MSLVTHFCKIDLINNSTTVMVTGECFKDKKATYPKLHDMDFIQPMDILLINKENKQVTLIHHEGQIFEY